MDGVLGYELDATGLTAEEKRQCREQIETYKKHYDLIAEGDYYRLTSPYENPAVTAWEHVSADKKQALLSLVLTDKESNAAQYYVKAKGLLADEFYRIDGMDGRYSGQLLMSAGLPVPFRLREYEAVQYYMEAEET